MKNDELENTTIELRALKEKLETLVQENNEMKVIINAAKASGGMHLPQF
jgi:hypothetical protein